MKTLTTKTLTLSLGRTSNQVIMSTNLVMEAQGLQPAKSIQMAVNRQATVRIWCKTGVTIRYSSQAPIIPTVTTSCSNNTGKRSDSRPNCLSLLKFTWMVLWTQEALTSQQALKYRLKTPNKSANLAQKLNLRTSQCAQVRWSSIDRIQAVPT